ncbi:hypothetical protein [Arthrobacter sp. NPDC057013]
MTAPPRPGRTLIAALAIIAGLAAVALANVAAAVFGEGTAP